MRVSGNEPFNSRSLFNHYTLGLGLFKQVSSHSLPEFLISYKLTPKCIGKLQEFETFFFFLLLKISFYRESPKSFSPQFRPIITRPAITPGSRR